MYYNVAKDIIINYLELLNKDEIEYLNNIVKCSLSDDNINIELFNKILNKIWSYTLTNVNDYATGCNFMFLVKLKNIVVEDLKIYDVNKSQIKLINESDMINLEMYDFGYIIKLDYNGNVNTPPLLPIYFIDNGYINVDKMYYNIEGMFVMDTKLNDMDTIYEDTKEECKQLNIPLILFNKMYYRNKLKLSSLTHNDLDSIAMLFYLEYIELYKDSMFKNGIGKDILIKDKLVHKLLLNYYDKKIILEDLKNKIYSRFKDIELSLLNSKNIKK